MPSISRQASDGEGQRAPSNATRAQSETQCAVPSSSSISVSEERTSVALQAWTAHQSHGQATILFYVPRRVHTDDLAITIGHDYIVAGVRARSPVVKARLSGRIDPATSAWQLERRRTGKRNRSHSRLPRRAQPRSEVSSSENSSNASGGSSRRSNAARSEDGEGSAAQQRNHPSLHRPPSGHEASTAPASSCTFSREGADDVPKQGSSSSGQRQPRSRTESLAGSDDSSSFDLLAHSVDTVGSRDSAASSSSNVILGRTDRSDDSPLSRDAPRSTGPATPPSLAQSVTLSEESGYIHPASAGIRSLDSSMSAAENTSCGSLGSRSRHVGDDDVDETYDARLVTLHLSKVDGGIWPCLVAGPAPVAPEELTATLPQLLSQKSYTSISAALSEALGNRAVSRENQAAHQPHSRSQSAESASEENSEPAATSSTLTVDTIGSDDSTTVLGTSRVQNEEEQYNMDATSLTLIGLQCARHSQAAPFNAAISRETSLAFEYFRRAWRQGEVPLAIERLVEDYLPLPASSDARMQDPAALPKRASDALRPRLIAALGGPTALSRLYLSYARLQLPSSEHLKPLLSLPVTGVANNPFGTYVPNEHQLQPGSPRGRVRSHTSETARTPLNFLEEARRLDAIVGNSITEVEWREAAEFDEQSRAADWPHGPTSQQGAASPSSRSDGAYDSASSYSVNAWGAVLGNDQQRLRSKRRKRASRRNVVGSGGGNNTADRNLNPSSGPSPADQGLVFLVVSRAALLSVMVAGGMAVAGWWRRAAAAGGG